MQQFALQMAERGAAKGEARGAAKGASSAFRVIGCNRHCTTLRKQLVAKGQVPAASERYVRQAAGGRHDGSTHQDALYIAGQALTPVANVLFPCLVLGAAAALAGGGTGGHLSPRWGRGADRALHAESASAGGAGSTGGGAASDGDRAAQGVGGGTGGGWLEGGQRRREERSTVPGVGSPAAAGLQGSMQAAEGLSTRAVKRPLKSLLGRGLRCSS